jgi:two-component system sensor histidine kinase TctE
LPWRGASAAGAVAAAHPPRESTDLSPLAETDVPDEVAPLVRAINDLLQRLDRTIATQRHFLADAAHQLKTPLAGLRMQAELAAREIDSGRGDPASMKHSLRQIALSTQRAAHMVNQLLAMARAEDTGQVMRKTPVDLAAITRAVVRDFVPRAIERQIDLGYEGPEQRRRLAPDGRTRAAGRTGAQPGGQRLALHAQRRHGHGARAGRRQAHQTVVLQVEDTGPGIAPAEREAVFRPFYRALGTQVDGSGLGLAIVQEIAQRHDAEITVADARPRSGADSGTAGHDVHAAFSAAAATTPAGAAAPPRPPASRHLLPAPEPQPSLNAAKPKPGQDCIRRRLRATDIRMPSPRPSDTMAVPP